MNYDIHAGSIMGLPARILMFFAALVLASLPVAGSDACAGQPAMKEYTS